MPLVYKFLSAETALRVLETKQLKVSRLTELNDIYDCSPRISPPPEEPTHTDDTWTKHVTTTNWNGFGLLCLSNTYKSPLLWGHYSSCATGLALGFDSDLFPWQNPMEIRYDHSRPHFQWPAEADMNDDTNAHMLRCSFGVKAIEWGYEEEVRWVLALNTCRPSRGMYFAPYPMNALKRVIVGHRSAITGVYLYNFLRHHFPNCAVEIMPSRLHPTLYEIAI